MKKVIVSLALVAGLGLNASAWYFDGGLTGTTGPDGYSGYKLNVRVGQDELSLEPSLTRYTSDALKKDYSTYALRGAMEKEKYTVGAEAATTPEVNGYKNLSLAGDITFSLTPGSGGHSRLAGPGARASYGGGSGVARVDVGASLKQTQHTQAVAGASDKKTSETAAMLFAGAKVLMLNLSASFTGYSYGDEKATPQDFVSGQNFVVQAQPKSSVNARVDIPSTIPLVTPFAGYTTTKYKGGSAAAKTDKSSTVTLGGYVDLNMVVANLTYQIFSYNDHNKSFVSIGAGLKF